MRNKIDWINHSVAFFSALLGILIAFQLEDYQDRRQENEKLEVTLGAIRSEIENNRRIYQTNVEKLTDFVEYFELNGMVDGKGELVLEDEKFERMKLRSPGRFSEWVLVRRGNNGTSVFTNCEFVIDVAPETGISTSSWKAGLFEGVLNRLDHDKLSKITHIYEWVEKDIGLNERDFYENSILNDITLIAPIIDHFKKIVVVQKFKLGIIDSYYNEIDWDQF